MTKRCNICCVVKIHFHLGRIDFFVLLSGMIELFNAELILNWGPPVRHDVTPSNS